MKHQYLKNVATLQYLPEKCSGCGKCTEVCPHGVFAIEHNKAIIADKNSYMKLELNIIKYMLTKIYDSQ